jgi:hypothetical protein
MLKAHFTKLLLAATVAAGMGLLFAQAPGNAASSSSCMTQARAAAAEKVPAGSAGYERRFRRAFDIAYADCTGGRNMGTSMETHAMAAAPAPEQPAPGGTCDFAKYHSSWDPTQC